jgi:hypothetical protein
MITPPAPRAGATEKDQDTREVYFEFTSIGSSVRVAAVDATTGIEIIVIGPASASTADLQRLALGKLKARLAKGEAQP